MLVQDLNIAADLDQAALSVIAGGRVVGRRLTSTSRTFGSWRYHGERRLQNLGSVYQNGKKVTMYKSKRTWTRTQTHRSYYNILVA